MSGAPATNNARIMNSPQTVAFITGITGQDGSYLAEHLLSRGYEVHGAVRRTSTLSRSRLSHLYNDPTVYNERLFLHYCDLQDMTTLRRILHKIAPDEFYHLAGQSHVGLSFEIPETTAELTAMAALRLLEILRDLPNPPRLLHASSSEIFGDPIECPQNERTPMNPITPYGCAKAFASQMTRIYRKEYGLYTCNAISYNHESPRRGENFVTRKICRAAAEIALGRRKTLELGNIEAQRDWSDARDFVVGFRLALQAEKPADYIFASGNARSVSDILDHAFGTVDLQWQNYVQVDAKHLRPADPVRLIGDPSRARNSLSWNPRFSFQQTIAAMTEAELAALFKESFGARRRPLILPSRPADRFHPAGPAQTLSFRFPNAPQNSLPPPAPRHWRHGVPLRIVRGQLPLPTFPHPVSHANAGTDCLGPIRRGSVVLEPHCDHPESGRADARHQTHRPQSR